MTPGDAARVLAACMMFDGREMPKDQDMEETLIMSWYSVIGDLGLDEALEAVRRHYRVSTKWAMPAHIHEQVAQIRKERRELAPPHEIRALPSKFETDIGRTARVQRGMGQARTALEAVFEAMAVRSGSPAARDALAELRQITSQSEDQSPEEKEGGMRA